MMCVIVDANVAGEVFGDGTCPASQKLFEWINKGKGRLVVGGHLLEELQELSAFKNWAKDALLSGSMRIANECKVTSREEQLKIEGEYKSTDPHVIALAQVSGARLLYSRDLALHSDFKNKKLIDNPRGKVYSTHKDKDFTRGHARLLSMKNLCASR